MAEILQETEAPGTATDIFLLNTMRGLEAGLTTGTIASSPIVTCAPGDDPEEVLSRPEWADFDVLPVEDNQRIVAVVERLSRSRRGLDSGMLVASSQPLETFLATPGFIEDGYRLVVYSAQIGGIVTPSDLLRLPVRVLAFALLSHLEHTMNTLIDARRVEPQTWLGYLSPKRQRELKKDQRKLQKQRMNPDLLEFTYLSEKIRILEALNLLNEDEGGIASDLKELRNQVAHNRNYVGNQDELQQFVERIRGIRPFFTQLQSRAASIWKGSD